MAKKKANKSGRITAKRVQATEDQPPPKLPDVEAKPENDDDEACEDDGLNVRRRDFVAAITGPAMGNAIKAAKMAGYASENRLSLKATAARLLSYVTVQRAISHALAQKHLTPEWTKNQVADLATASLDSFISIVDGQPVIDWEKAAAAGAIGHIKELREDVIKVGDSPVETIKRTFKIHDRFKALELLARMQGLVKAEPPEPEERSFVFRPARFGNADSPSN